MNTRIFTNIYTRAHTVLWVGVSIRRTTQRVAHNQLVSQFIESHYKSSLYTKDLIREFAKKMA